MKALTLKQPWASLIIYGYNGTFRDIENRDWALPSWIKGKRVAIHSSKTKDMSEWDGAIDMCYERGLPNFDIVPMEFPLGCILGTVLIADCVRESESPWFVGDYGFVLREPQAFKRELHT